ncbi:MAG: hypothetical protein FWC21_03040 [Treponema sp.]|nr:hypothetical protein [Treponema sp.]
MSKIKLIFHNFITFLAIFFVIMIVLSCFSTPEVNEEEPAEVAVDPGPVPVTVIAQPEIPPVVTEYVFDPTNVSHEYYSSIRSEVRNFIGRLNAIVRNHDYNTWLLSLSQEYIDYYSSPDFLHEQSQQPLLRMSNRTLHSLNDYFVYVFVPSRTRANINLEDVDIEFISEHRVRAFITRESDGEREILYTLEEIDDIWRISN